MISNSSKIAHNRQHGFVHQAADVWAWPEEVGLAVIVLFEPTHQAPVAGQRTCLIEVAFFVKVFWAHHLVKACIDQPAELRQVGG